MINPIEFLVNYEIHDYGDLRETEKNYFVYDMNLTLFKERHPGQTDLNFEYI